MPSTPRIEVGDWVDAVVNFLRDHGGGFFDLIGTFLRTPAGYLQDWLLILPAPIMALIAGLIAWRVHSAQFAIFAVLGFLLIDSMQLWFRAMQTLALITTATVVAVGLAVPIGILAARNSYVSAVVRPVLDFMQTLPAFVYLIPAVFFFGVGIGPGLVATLIFAIPPGIRLTELGIRQVDAEVVEAARAFGAGDNRILVRVQLPLALPTIMAGVNQVIMLALSMVVIAGFVGAGGLGGEVVRGIQRLNMSVAAEAGIAVVILAMFLDRITEAIGRRVDPSKTSA